MKNDLRLIFFFFLLSPNKNEKIFIILSCFSLDLMEVFFLLHSAWIPAENAIQFNEKMLSTCNEYYSLAMLHRHLSIAFLFGVSAESENLR